MSKFKNLIGMKFGRLLVISRAENKGHNVRWNCICDCGKKTISSSYSLTSGRSKSCAKKYNINYKLAHERYKKGWEFERIFS